ncbi:hypothetical protein BB561_000538 [Smittium simulii]|uniref:N-acyl-aliphatic-L-amino acid amidohydrolase n=1 Tax=Smittium simulii TaxID=133385 RepID=A0A2T9YYL0_9FUNG|nr:hypothetical protein BB561_000538 [Smittium simulii]
MEAQSVTRFRKYLQIKSVHPNPDYWGIVEFLKEQAQEIGLEFQVVECVKNKPIVVLKLAGTDPSLQSVLFNSHSDVVPVFEENWKYPPFGAERVKQENGDYHIYARGAQDMKMAGSCYLEAMRELKLSGKIPKRNIFALYVPDEEIGGRDGMGSFVNTAEFKALNAGFDIDEGINSSNSTTVLMNSERTLCWVKLIAHGNTGHGSQFIEGTAIEKLLPVVNELMKFREQQLNSLNNNIKTTKMEEQGHYTSVNLTMLDGGKQANVVPATFSAVFDIRITPDVNYIDFFNWVEKLAADNGVEVEYITRDDAGVVTSLDESDIFIKAMNKVCKSFNLRTVPFISPGITDARYVRKAGVPAVGLNPVTNIPLLAHDHNEYIRESDFISSISFYSELMSELGNAS